MRRSHHWSINWSIWVNYNDLTTSEPCKSWLDCEESSPNGLSSGLWIIIICPDQLINEWTNPIQSNPSDPSINQSVQSICQSINPINQSTNQPINWSMNQCTMNQWIFNIHVHMVYTYRKWGRILPPTHARLKNDLVPKLGPIYPWQRNIKNVANELRQAWPDQKVTSIQESKKKWWKRLAKSICSKISFSSNHITSVGTFLATSTCIASARNARCAGGRWNCFGVWVY